MLDKDKCQFADNLYNETFYTNWQRLEKQISDNPAQVYNYNLFIQMLQDKLISKEIR